MYIWEIMFLEDVCFHFHSVECTHILFKRANFLSVIWKTLLRTIFKWLSKWKDEIVIKFSAHSNVENGEKSFEHLNVCERKSGKYRKRILSIQETSLHRLFYKLKVSKSFECNLIKKYKMGSSKMKSFIIFYQSRKWDYVHHDPAKSMVNLLNFKLHVNIRDNVHVLKKES